MDEAARHKLAEYIFEWLESRNGNELYQALANMTVESRRHAIDELKHILLHGGRPPNWVPRGSQVRTCRYLLEIDSGRRDEISRCCRTATHTRHGTDLCAEHAAKYPGATPIEGTP